MVDRDAVMRYKARVHRNVGKVAETHPEPMLQQRRGGANRASNRKRDLFSPRSSL